MLLWAAVEVADTAYWSNKLISIVVSAVNAIIIIIFIARFINIKAYVKLFGIIITLIAILNIFDLLQPALNLLDGISVQIGEVKLTVLSVSKGLFYFFILLWLYLTNKRIKVEKSLLPAIIFYGIIFGAEFMFLYIALDLTSVIRVTIMFYTMPIWLALMNHFLLKNDKIGILKYGDVNALSGISYFPSSRLPLDQLLKGW